MLLMTACLDSVLFVATLSGWTLTAVNCVRFSMPPLLAVAALMTILVIVGYGVFV